jgi:hypothetical protein
MIQFLNNVDPVTRAVPPAKAYRLIAPPAPSLMQVHCFIFQIQPVFPSAQTALTQIL